MRTDAQKMLPRLRQAAEAILDEIARIEREAQYLPAVDHYGERLPVSDPRRWLPDDPPQEAPDA